METWHRNIYETPYQIPALYTVICNKSTIENLFRTSLVSNDRTFLEPVKYSYIYLVVLLSERNWYMCMNNSTVRNLFYTVHFISYIAMIGNLLGTFVHMDI